MDEQGIEQIPVAYYIIKGDHLAHDIVGQGYDFNFPNMYAAMYVEHNGPMPEDGVIQISIMVELKNGLTNME